MPLITWRIIVFTNSIIFEFLMNICLKNIVIKLMHSEKIIKMLPTKKNNNTYFKEFITKYNP